MTPIWNAARTKRTLAILFDAEVTGDWWIVYPSYTPSLLQNY